jgi:hypothetical protein
MKSMAAKLAATQSAERQFHAEPHGRSDFPIHG